MIVVDTSALVSILANEPDAALYVRILVSGAPSNVWSTGTALEACIVARRKLGDDGVTRLDELVAEFAVRAIPFDEAQLFVARVAYERYGRGSGNPARLNYGDCFSYALAKSLDAPLLFKGDDFVHTDIRSVIEP